ncbi:hypothetical protein DFJ73DRAFT_948078 [Zopfochytrium polystomum]|nr:hypothetical protein DFJ73DRAFT_948078 [Zopfochytrium polystomum]
MSDPPSPLHDLTAVVVAGGPDGSGSRNSSILGAVWACELLHPRHGLSRVHLWLRDPPQHHLNKSSTGKLSDWELFSQFSLSSRLTIHHTVPGDDPTDCGVAEADVFLNCVTRVHDRDDQDEDNVNLTRDSLRAAQRARARLFVHASSAVSDSSVAAEELYLARCRQAVFPKIAVTSEDLLRAASETLGLETATIRLPVIGPSMQHPYPGWWPSSAGLACPLTASYGCADLASTADSADADVAPVDACAVYATTIVRSLLRRSASVSTSGGDGGRRRRRDHGAFTLCAEATAMMMLPPSAAALKNPKAPSDRQADRQCLTVSALPLGVADRDAYLGAARRATRWSRP